MRAILKLHKCISHYTSRYDAQLTDWGGSFVSLALRLFVGWQFFKAGMVKVSDWTATFDLFRNEYHVPLLPPELAAVMGAGGELLFPMLLALGLFSRPAALGLFAMNLMAVISYPQLFAFDCPAAINDHFYWGILLLALTVFGPGRFALDTWIAKRSG